MATDLQRGSVPLQRGDLCGQRAQLLREEVKERAATIENSIREIQDPDVQLILVPIPGRTSSFALPKFVYDAIKRSAR